MKTSLVAILTAIIGTSLIGMPVKALSSPVQRHGDKTCVIVYANDRQSSTVIYWHEMAHCLGWDHPEKAPPKEGENYVAYEVPHRYDGLVYAGPLVVHSVTTKAAKAMCDGHYGCQWWED